MDAVFLKQAIIDGEQIQLLSLKEEMHIAFILSRNFRCPKVTLLHPKTTHIIQMLYHKAPYHKSKLIIFLKTS